MHAGADEAIIMRIEFEKAGDGNSDLEIIFVSLAVLGLVTGWIVPIVGFIMPACQFRRFTGWPCPGCGGTRAGGLLSCGHVIDAFSMSPLVTLLAVVAAAFALYSALALVFRLPRFRIRLSNSRERRVLWAVFIMSAAAHWIYLIAVGR